MSIRRYDAKRDKNEPMIVAAFEAMNCQVYRIDVPCDLLVCCRQDVLLVEVKTEAGRLTEDQVIFARTWPLHVVRSVDDVIRLVTKTMRKAA